MTLSKRICIVVIALTFVFSLSIPALAANTSDARFSYIFSRHEDKTDFRPKEDNSPVYFKCMDTTNYFYASVLGSDRTVGCAYPVSTEKYIPKADTYYLDLNVYYTQYAEYAVMGRESYWDSAAWGYWSPDSKPH